MQPCCEDEKEAPHRGVSIEGTRDNPTDVSKLCVIQSASRTPCTRARPSKSFEVNIVMADGDTHTWSKSFRCQAKQRQGTLRQK